MALGKDKTSLTMKDFAALTRGGVLCSLQGQLSLEQFDLLCHELMCDYVQQQSAKIMLEEAAVVVEEEMLLSMSFGTRYHAECPV
jgi:hypothetical protein